MKKREGFTLIELLVVIAIIGMLLAIIAPALNMAKEKARDLICATHCKGIGLAMQIYFQENDNKTYSYRDSAGNMQANEFQWKDPVDPMQDISPIHHEAYWGVAYLDYIEKPDVFGCPSFRVSDGTIYDTNTEKYAPDLKKHASYGLNYNFIDRRVGEFKIPSLFIISHDHVEPRFEQGSNDMLHNDGPGTMNLKHYRAGGHREEFYRGIFRHNNKVDKPFETRGSLNIIFLDGHTERLNETTGDNIKESQYTG